MIQRSVCSRRPVSFSPWPVMASTWIYLEAFSNVASVPPTVCSANVDIPTGNLFWVPCNRGTIQKTRMPGAESFTLYSTQNIILQLLLDWPRRMLYWVESGMPLQRMTLDGKNRQEVWRGTWAADTPMALDLGSASILWTTKGVGKYCTTYNTVLGKWGRCQPEDTCQLFILASCFFLSISFNFTFIFVFWAMVEIFVLNFWRKQNGCTYTRVELWYFDTRI